jgi:cysteine desulfurase family protein
MIYLDNAASSWPKPPEVNETMTEVLRECGANPGRSGHQMSVQAGELIYTTRSNLAKLFGVHNPDDIAFTQNATEALNLGLKGFLQPGDHVITTSFEHNSVRRPLEYLRKLGVEITYINGSSGVPLPREIEAAVKTNTKLLVITHASNLTGVVFPIEEYGRVALKHNIKTMVDASQTAGYLPIDVQEMGIDLLAFTGHKSLYGPQGTGGLYIHPEIELQPLLHGGTGGYSELIEQPPVRPDRYESGTRNTVGISGLGAGVRFVEKTGLDAIRNHEEKLTTFLTEGLAEQPAIKIYTPENGTRRCPIVSFSVDGYAASEVGYILDQHYQIAVRAGLHCSPLAHESLGTTQEGLVRASFGFYNTVEHVEELLNALKDITS